MILRLINSLQERSGSWINAAPDNRDEWMRLFAALVLWTLQLASPFLLVWWLW